MDIVIFGYRKRELQEIRKSIDSLRNEISSGFSALNTSLQKGTQTMDVELDALTAQVTANTTVEASAVALIQGLAAQIAANATDPAKLTALSAQLKTSADALAAAITANTPAAPAS